MGGSITIAARFNDGQAICIDGWTNFIPNMVMNDTTLSGNDAVVRETLLEASDMEMYDGPQPFRASGYGIVVIDFVAHQIHSMQGYTSFERKYPNSMLDFKATGWKDGVYVNVLTPEAERLLDAGRVRHVKTNGEHIDPVVMTRTSIIDMLNAERRAFFKLEETRFAELAYDVSPFVVHEYPEGGSLTTMKQRLKAAGFPMTKAAGLNAMLARG